MNYRTFEETCPYCDNVNKIQWDGVSRVGECEKCGKAILFCNICEMDKPCGVCPYAQKKIEVSDIEWDAPKSAGLPKQVIIDININNIDLLVDIDGCADNLSDYLSDTYGFCHYGFTAQVI